MSPHGNPSHQASVSGSASASVSKTHGEEPGSIPIQLGDFGCSQAVPPGPEGRQMIAQRVSAGFCPPMKASPGGATDPPSSATANSHSPPATSSPRNPRPLPLRVFASSRETLWPQSREDGRKNHRKSQKDTVPIRRSRLPRTLVMPPISRSPWHAAAFAPKGLRPKSHPPTRLNRVEKRPNHRHFVAPPRKSASNVNSTGLSPLTRFQRSDSLDVD